MLARWVGQSVLFNNYSLLILIHMHLLCTSHASWPSWALLEGGSCLVKLQICTARFKQVEAAIAAGEAAPWLLRCEPVEDNLMELGGKGWAA